MPSNVETTGLLTRRHRNHGILTPESADGQTRHLVGEGLLLEDQHLKGTTEDQAIRTDQQQGWQQTDSEPSPDLPHLQQHYLERDHA